MLFNFSICSVHLTNARVTPWPSSFLFILHWFYSSLELVLFSLCCFTVSVIHKVGKTGQGQQKINKKPHLFANSHAGPKESPKSQRWWKMCPTSSLIYFSLAIWRTGCFLPYVSIFYVVNEDLLNTLTPSPLSLMYSEVFSLVLIFQLLST